MEGVAHILFVFLVVLLVLAGPFSAAMFKTSMYNMQISNCDRSLYENSTKWFLGDYYFVPAIGVCPKQHTKTKRSGDGERLIYRKCINFKSDSDVWKEIDQGNQANGYSSDMNGGSKKWLRAYNLLVPACVLSYALYAISFCTSDFEKDVSCFLLGLVSVPVSFALFLGVIFIISKTDQLDPKAWESYYFASCDVKIFKSTSYHLLILCILCTGMPTLLLMIGLCFAYKEKIESIAKDPLPSGVQMTQHTQVEEVGEAEYYPESGSSSPPPVAEAQIIVIPYANVKAIHSSIKDSRNAIVRQFSSESFEVSSPCKEEEGV